MRKYSCGVPEKYCNGSSVICDMNVSKKTLKVHSGPDEAFKCHVKYLVNILGYTRLGSREFIKDENSPIMVLTKKSRFGGIFRQGKHGGEGGGSMGKGKRVVPKGKLLGGWVASY